MSLGIQTFIHRLHVGPTARVFHVLFVLTLATALAGFYDILAYRNFHSREAMDMAQLGKNLAEGRGYTTLLVRPFSMFLLQRHRADQSPELKGAHPDLANPPVYPTLLAGLFKLVPAKYFKCRAGEEFSIFVPELVVTIFNQGLFLVAALLLFFLATRLLDATLAWISTIVFVGTELLWRFSASGLSTMLLVVLLLAAVWCLVLLEQWARFGRHNVLLVAMAALAGVVIGVGGLTRYAFGWLMVPTLVFFLAFFQEKRALFCLASLVGFLAVLSPWLVRNYHQCGLPFGTATFALCEETGAFPEDRLVRSLHPNLQSVSLGDFAKKFLKNGRDLVQNDLPKLGGNWINAFFLVGLLVPFRRPALSRLRWLLLLSLVVLGCVQLLGRTCVWSESPEVNSENLLVVLSPLVVMYGVALFFTLLDALALPLPALRVMILALFCLVTSLPLIQAFLPPHSRPMAYPPYYPPLVQRIGGWFRQDEMLMSDMPWAVAWYGRRQCVLLTLNWQKDFLEITDYHKGIRGLYLTQLTTDAPFLSNWVKGENRSWASFLLEGIVRREVPTGFPLRRAPDILWPEQFVLTDYDRWKVKTE
jgi:hypothetical protein